MLSLTAYYKHVEFRHLKIIYIIGIIFLFLGLFWLMALELPFFGFHDDPNLKILLYILPGLIPTLLGIYLIECYNKIIKYSSD